MKKIKNILRNERGLTLIELLAVVVILAIIAAIAIPAIGGLMDNTKKDAHVANAQQMISSARLYVTADKASGKGTTTVKLSKLISDKYMEAVEDPDGNDTNGYDIEKSFVRITNGKVDWVTLVGSERNISSLPNKLNRDSVKTGINPADPSPVTNP